jgi:hypothetical protein
MVRRDDCAEASFAERRDASRFGIAIDVTIPMMATTINSSIKENPFRVSVLVIAFDPFRFTTKCL